MKKRIAWTMVLIMILCAACLVGCSISFSKEKETEEPTKEGETVISFLKSDNVTIKGNIQTAVEVKSEKIGSDKELYSKIKNTVMDNNLVLIEIYYINLYDKTGEKVKQLGEAEFTLKLSEALKKAGGDTYKLYYYNSNKGEASEVDFTKKDGVLNFKSDNIGFFAILNINNTGKEITKPAKEPETAKPTKPVETKAEPPVPTKGQPIATEAPVVKPTEAPTKAPVVKPTEAPTKAPVVKPTEAPTKAPEIPMPPASGNKETPDFAVINTDKTKSNCRVFSIDIINNGNSVMRILSDKCNVYGIVSEYDRELNLVLSTAIPDQVQYVDIAPGERKTVAFCVLGQNTYYSRESVTEFTFYYDGLKYECDTGNLSGTNVKKM